AKSEVRSEDSFDRATPESLFAARGVGIAISGELWRYRADTRARLERAGGVAASWVAALVAGEEPALPLRGRAVRERVGRHAALGLLLDAVVADSRGGVERARD